MSSHVMSRVFSCCLVPVLVRGMAWHGKAWQGIVQNFQIPARFWVLLTRQLCAYIVDDAY